MQFSIYYVAACCKSNLKSKHLSWHPYNYAIELEINDSLVKVFFSLKKPVLSFKFHNKV